MKTIGYLRVSTIEQDLEKNKADILNLANNKNLGKVHWVKEKVSGRISWKKRKIGDLINELQAGDNLIVSELSRFGRSTLECLEMFNICSEKKINVLSVKENWVLDNSLNSKVTKTIFSLVAEIERDFISQRTKEALRAKKEAGIKLGRPIGSGKSKLDKYKEEIQAMIQTGVTKKYIAKKYEISEAGFYNWLKKQKIR